MSTTPRNLGIRLDQALSDRLTAFENRTGVGAATLGRNALIAALDYFEKHQRISFPLVLVERDAEGKTIPFPVKGESLRVAEEPGTYSEGKRGKRG